MMANVELGDVEHLNYFYAGGDPWQWDLSVLFLSYDKHVSVDLRSWVIANVELGDVEHLIYFYAGGDPFH